MLTWCGERSGPGSLMRPAGTRIPIPGQAQSTMRSDGEYSGPLDEKLDCMPPAVGGTQNAERKASKLARRADAAASLTEKSRLKSKWLSDPTNPYASAEVEGGAAHHQAGPSSAAAPAVTLTRGAGTTSRAAWGLDGDEEDDDEEYDDDDGGGGQDSWKLDQDLYASEVSLICQ